MNLEIKQAILQKIKEYHRIIIMRHFRPDGDAIGSTKGLWPFVSYTTLDEREGELLTIDCYVYSPKYGKRNFLRPLEHLIYGVKFPTKKD